MDTANVIAIVVGVLQLCMGVIMALMGILLGNLLKQLAVLQKDLTDLRIAAMPREEYLKLSMKRDEEIAEFEKESRKDRHRLRNIVNGLCVKIGYVPPQTQEDIV